MSNKGEYARAQKVEAYIIHPKWVNNFPLFFSSQASDTGQKGVTEFVPKESGRYTFAVINPLYINHNCNFQVVREYNENEPYTKYETRMVPIKVTVIQWLLEYS